MKKKIIILIVVVGLIVFVILSNFTYLGVFFDYSELAIFDSKLVCKLIPNSFESNKCMSKVIFKRKDIAACEKEFRRIEGFTSEEFKSSCYWTVAKATKDVVLCDKATFHKNWCIRSIALLTGDKNLCDKLPKKEERGNILETYRESCEREVERVREHNFKQ